MYDCPIMGLGCILTLPLGRLLACMYDCPIVDLDYISKLPLGRLLDMYV